MSTVYIIHQKKKKTQKRKLSKRTLSEREREIIPMVKQQSELFFFDTNSVKHTLASSHALRACDEAFFLAKKKLCVFILYI